MFIIKRNQVIITALVVMVAVAGYLNFVDTTATDQIALIEESDLTGALVANDDSYIYSGTDVVDGEIGIAMTEDGSVQTAQVDATAALALDAAVEEDETKNLNSSEKEDVGTAVFVNTTSDTSFFVQAKLEREQSRSKRKDMLTEIINNQNIAAEQKAECANAIIELQERIEKETSAEAMIEAKGFSEAYVRIDEDTVDVVVNKEALSEAEIAQIEDIVKRKTGVNASQIRINPLKR